MMMFMRRTMAFLRSSSEFDTVMGMAVTCEGEC